MDFWVTFIINLVCAVLSTGTFAYGCIACFICGENKKGILFLIGTLLFVSIMIPMFINSFSNIPKEPEEIKITATVTRVENECVYFVQDVQTSQNTQDNKYAGKIRVSPEIYAQISEGDVITVTVISSDSEHIYQLDSISLTN